VTVIIAAELIATGAEYPLENLYMFPASTIYPVSGYVVEVDQVVLQDGGELIAQRGGGNCHPWDEKFEFFEEFEFLEKQLVGNLPTNTRAYCTNTRAYC